jgi:hypothetical protein
MVFGSVQIPFGCVQRFTAGGRLGGGPKSGLCMERQKIMSQSTGWVENIVECRLLVAQEQRVHCRAIGERDRIFH